jgi:DNA polymerase-3 subunit delta'
MIQRALACERMPHAYLFVGPDGVGKQMLAERLAQLLLCEAPTRCEPPAEVGLEGGVEPCGKCQECLLVKAGTHPDLMVVYRQLSRQHPESRIRKLKALTLSVDVVRHFLVDRAGTRPSRGRAKVFIVREAERLNDAAQNCLLKTLEEPPTQTFLILLTHSLGRMLPTTRSRCQQVIFQTLPTSFVEQRLHTLRPDAKADVVKYLARHAAGSLGTALRDLDDGLYALKHAWCEQVSQLTTGTAELAPTALAKPLVADAKTLGKCIIERDPDVSETDATRAGLRTLLSVLGDLYLDVLRRKQNLAFLSINEDQEEFVEAMTEEMSVTSLHRSLQYLTQAEQHLASNAHVELTLETLFIRLADPARAPTLV